MFDGGTIIPVDPGNICTVGTAVLCTDLCKFPDHCMTNLPPWPLEPIPPPNGAMAAINSLEGGSSLNNLAHAPRMA